MSEIIIPDRDEDIQENGRQWRWWNTATGQFEEMDEWWVMLDAVRNAYPATWEKPEHATMDPRPYLLRHQIGWGFSDTNFDYANKICSISFATNNSPQPEYIALGGGRRMRKVFIMMEMAYRHVDGSKTDTYNNPPRTWIGTKRRIENIISANNTWLQSRGITYVAQPSVIQDGKMFGNFGMINSITTPINMFTDNNKWKYILLIMTMVDEVLI